MNLDPVMGSATYGAILKYEWFDEMLTWTPASYNGISNITLSVNDVWTPPLVIANPIDYKNLETSWMRVEYQPDGHATLSPFSIIQAQCTFYMKYFPFDMQKCTVGFFAFGYSDKKVSLSITSDGVDTSMYMTNPEWTLMKDKITYQIDTSPGMSVAYFHISLARMPGFYLLTVIMPMIGIAMLVCITFLVPTESGERIGYSVTILLALAVFLTITAEELPKTSDPTPIICVFILFTMIACIGMTILLILNLGIYYKDEDIPVTPFYKRLVRFTDSFGSCRRKNKKVGAQQTAGSTSVSIVNLDSETKINPNKAQSKLHDEDYDDNDENDGITWIKVSKAIDKILFVVAIVLTFIPTIIILMVLTLAADFGPETM
ncbi:hypothetical protein ACF0H5_018893 [Mactra antiquata]